MHHTERSGVRKFRTHAGERAAPRGQWPLAQPAHRLEREEVRNLDLQEKKRLCEDHMHRYVEIKTLDGCGYDGIVEHVDDEVVCLAVPGPVEDWRGYGYVPPRVPYGPFVPYPYGYGIPRYPYPRRFSRLVLPLAALVALSLLPYYW